jgi:hypothetical protein
MLKSIASILDDMLLSAAEKRTAEEFEAARKEIFPNYFKTVRAFSDLVRIVVPKDTLEKISAQSFAAVEADFREQGLTAFGWAIRDQVLFTVWTLRKISDHAHKIGSIELPDDLREQDTMFSNKFAQNAIWARFHLDCLIAAMYAKRTIYPEVLEEISAGLRAAVDAYAWIRQGLDLRLPTIEPEIQMTEWDPEEQELLNSSTREITTEQL